VGGKYLNTYEIGGDGNSLKWKFNRYIHMYDLFPASVSQCFSYATENKCIKPFYGLLIISNCLPWLSMSELAMFDQYHSSCGPNFSFV
jgi:hypothetical protein